ncbi:nucleotidyltransferase domain-containing protein [Candidatus Micrarchaeota archaeon]|nr:nucleotidyltransferase domain-containing protein [Candidatus Micrarchaeota archaeon]
MSSGKINGVDSQTDRKLNEFLKDIRTLYSDARVYLFGSRARGNQRKDSDYDLIVISRKFVKKDFIDRPETIWKNSDVVIGADLLCYTPAEFSRISKTSFVLREAMRDAIPL